MADDKLRFYSYNGYTGNILRFNKTNLVNIPSIIFPCFVLVRVNSWNDYNYVTHFGLFYFTNKNTKNYLGNVKIIQRNIKLNELSKRCETILPDQFHSLDTSNFFSRGYIDLYENLKNKVGGIRSEILHALNDVHIKAYMENDLNDEGNKGELISQFRQSLFRDEHDHLKPSKEYYENAIQILDDLNKYASSLKELVEDPSQLRFLIYMLYGSTITALETFLGDAFKYNVINKPNYLLAFARFHNYPKKKEENTGEQEDISAKKYNLIDMNIHGDNIRKFIQQETQDILDRINFHDVDKVYSLYKRILQIKLPSRLATFREDVNNRHLIFHRNGKYSNGTYLDIDIDRLSKLISEIKKFINSVNESLNVLL